MVWLAVFCDVLTSMPIHVLVMAVAFAACRVRLKTISFGQHPILLRRKLSGIDWELGAFIFAGFVAVEGEDKRRTTRVVWCLLSLIPSAALLAIGSLLGGWMHPYQVWSAIGMSMIHPVQVGAIHAREYAAAFSASPIAALGQFACAFGWLNLIPLPDINGGEALLALIFGTTRERPLSIRILRSLSEALFVWFYVAALIAMITATIHRG